MRDKFNLVTISLSFQSLTYKFLSNEDSIILFMQKLHKTLCNYQLDNSF